MYDRTGWICGWREPKRNRARSPGTDGFTSPLKEDVVKHLLIQWGRAEWTPGGIEVKQGEREKFPDTGWDSNPATPGREHKS